jgi:hypothetical protein
VYNRLLTRPDACCIITAACVRALLQRAATAERADGAANTQQQQQQQGVSIVTAAALDGQISVQRLSAAASTADVQECLRRCVFVLSLQCTSGTVLA